MEHLRGGQTTLTEAEGHRVAKHFADPDYKALDEPVSRPGRTRPAARQASPLARAQYPGAQEARLRGRDACR